MNSPLVSVHIVCYQQRDLIAETLESVLAQAYAPLQIIVADDGSQDGTAELVEDYARRYADRIIAVTGGPNLGISGNSNRCLRRCTGKYVAFLAGDDLMLPGKISAQVAWLEADAERVLCAHDVEHFDSATGRTLRLHSSITRPRTGAGTGEFLGRGYFSATSSIMVRASALPSYGFDERIRVHSDWKLAADCLVGGGKFGYVPGVLGRYRRHDRNATSVFPTCAGSNATLAWASWRRSTRSWRTPASKRVPTPTCSVPWRWSKTATAHRRAWRSATRSVTPLPFRGSSPRGGP